MKMENLTETTVSFIVTWQSSHSIRRRTIQFEDADSAERWFAEKFSDGKNPSLFVIECTTTTKQLK